MDGKIVVQIKKVSGHGPVNASSSCLLLRLFVAGLTLTELEDSPSAGLRWSTRIFSNRPARRDDANSVDRTRAFALQLGRILHQSVQSGRIEALRAGAKFGRCFHAERDPPLTVGNLP